MRTTIDIPDDLLEEARRASHSRTKKEAVLAGLKELIRRAAYEELRQLPGKIELTFDRRELRRQRNKR